MCRDMIIQRILDILSAVDDRTLAEIYTFIMEELGE